MEGLKYKNTTRMPVPQRSFALRVSDFLVTYEKLEIHAAPLQNCLDYYLR
jgi:hypothetical protein